MHSRSQCLTGREGWAYLLQQVNICPTGISTLKPVLPKTCELCIYKLSLSMVTGKAFLSFKMYWISWLWDFMLVDVLFYL